MHRGEHHIPVRFWSDRDRFLRLLFRDDGSSSPEPDGGLLRRPEWTPSLDVTEVDDGVRLVIDLPGVRREDLRVRVEHWTLFIEGERRRHIAPEREHRSLLEERIYGSFFRASALPVSVGQVHIRVSFENGVLTVRLPTAADERSRHVSIK